MNKGRVALWAVLALLGIVLAAGLTWSVMRLSGEHIGLASAPISVVRGLAPGPGAGRSAPPERDLTGTVTRTVTVSRTVTETGLRSGTATTPLPPPATATSSTSATSSRSATSAVTATRPSGSHTAGDRPGDGSDDSSRRSGAGRDD